MLEPSSPEPAKTQSSDSSSSGVLVLPCGTAFQMKRESEEDESLRKKRRSSISQDAVTKVVHCPPSPPSKVIIEIMC